MPRFRLERTVPAPDSGGFGAPVDAPREFKIVEIPEGQPLPAMPGLKVESVPGDTTLVAAWTEIEPEEEEN